MNRTPPLELSLRSLAGAMLCLAAWLDCAWCQEAGRREDPMPTELQASAAQAEQTDAYVASALKKQRIPGLALAVVRDGRLAMARGYGLANVELNVPVTPETVFQLQSVTKQFTAAAIMMLVEEGKLSLEDKVGKHLDGSPPSWNGITVRHLLSHTSGIKDFINEPTASLRLDVTEEEVFQATAPRPLNFVPGAEYRYSNTNYHLLAMILRKLTGQSYGEFLRRRVFEPLEMKHTRVVSLSAIIPNRAAGYRIGKDGLRNGDYVAESILAYAGGGLCSTVLDLARWDAALCGEKLLKRATLDQMWTPARLNDGKTAPYGLGWGVSDLRGHRAITHAGGHVTGFSTIISRFPDDRVTVIVLTNGTPASPAAVANHVAGIFVPALARPEDKPIPDKDPKAAALIRSLYADWARGRLREGLFTEDGWRAVRPRPERFREMLEILGPVDSIALLDRRDEDAGRWRRYRVGFGDRALEVDVTLAAGDKIAELRAEEL